MSVVRIMAELRALWRDGLRPGSAAAYSFALVCLAIATVLRLGLGLFNPDLVAFDAYYPAILLVTFLGGTAAGVLTLVLGGLAAWWAFLFPRYHFFPIAQNDVINLVVYACVGAVIVWTVETLRRARQKLTEHLQAAGELTAIVTYSGDAIIGFGLDTRIRTWNLGAERMFGYRAEEVIGKPLSVIVPPEKQDEPTALFPRSSAGEILQWETVRMAKSGQRINVSISTGPIRAPSGAITGVSGVFHDITERKQREEHVNFVMRELSHRAKNLLAVIQAIARQTGRQAKTFDVFEERFTARLQSLAHSHDILVKRDWRGGTLQDLVTSQISPFSSRVTAEGPDLLLSPRAVEQLGIALHELATNAVKHGALSVASGSIGIIWAMVTDGDGGAKRLRVHWSERGGPVVTPPTREGFGHRVVKKLVPLALDGTASLEFLPEGVSWTLVMPATEVIDMALSAS